MTTVWHYEGLSKNYFPYTTSVTFTSPGQILLPNVQWKKKPQCFLLLKTAFSDAELGHLLLSHWVSY